MIAILRTGCGCTQTMDLGPIKEPPNDIMRPVIDMDHRAMWGVSKKLDHTTSCQSRLFRRHFDIGKDVWEYVEHITR